MQGIFTSVTEPVRNIAADLTVFVHRYFGNHLGGSSSGLYIRLPLTRVSAWVEWRNKSMGWGALRSTVRDVELFAGRLVVVASVEHR